MNMTSQQTYVDQTPPIAHKASSWLDHLYITFQGFFQAQLCAEQVSICAQAASAKLCGS